MVCTVLVYTSYNIWYYCCIIGSSHTHGCMDDVAYDPLTTNSYCRLVWFIYNKLPTMVVVHPVVWCHSPQSSLPGKCIAQTIALNNIQCAFIKHVSISTWIEIVFPRQF